MTPLNQGASSGGLLALAERVEAAAGPDRETDVLIERECGPLSHTVRELEAGSPLNTIAVIAECADGRYFKVPTYTASIDAALTLVPEQHKWSVFGGGYASVEPWDGSADNEECSLPDRQCATPELALCAAALKARAAQGGE